MHVLKVGTPTPKTHLDMLQQFGTPPRGGCWNFTHVLVDTETQLLQTTLLVAIDTVFTGSTKPVVQRVELTSELLTATSPVAWV